jgi:hypothetical protein
MEETTAAQKQLAGLFGAKSSAQRAVRAREGNLWTLRYAELPWEHRQPFHPTAETELEPISGHYKGILRLPF